MRNTVLISALLLFGSFATQAADPDPDAVVVQRGDIIVTYEDVERYIEENTPPDPGEKAAVLADPDIFGKMAEMLYTVRYLAAEAEQMPDFDKEQAAWNKQMIYQRRISRDYREKYVQHMLRDVNWEATAKEAYITQKDMYQTQEAVSASHILIQVNAERSEEQALQLAEQLRDRAVKGEDFGDLAVEYSEDPSAARNSGNLGTFQKGRMVKPFEEAVWEAEKEGEIIGPVRTKFGYHVIQFHSRVPPKPIPFERVEEQIVEELKTQMANKVWQDKLLQVRSSDEIKTDTALLEALKNEHQTVTGLGSKGAATPEAAQ